MATTAMFLLIIETFLEIFALSLITSDDTSNLSTLLQSEMAYRYEDILSSDENLSCARFGSTFRQPPAVRKTGRTAGGLSPWAMTSRRDTAGSIPHNRQWRCRHKTSPAGIDGICADPPGKPLRPLLRLVSRDQRRPFVCGARGSQIPSSSSIILCSRLDTQSASASKPAVR